MVPHRVASQVQVRLPLTARALPLQGASAARQLAHRQARLACQWGPRRAHPAQLLPPHCGLMALQQARLQLRIRAVTMVPLLIQMVGLLQGCCFPTCGLPLIFSLHLLL